ncbi:alginate O-acetyltransferase AlgF [Castellaniella sp.]|uniref:alginate O-acetyltransferase AlgF n=1 Tax=Castellaniella sp. TaxID=1955812 RepID=UPI002AFFDF2E|nr:alginate O-acetyltransferase AlgF [Castellaniella sp.]
MWITRLVLFAMMLPAPMVVQAQELTRLYAPRPPAGSAYVRIVDLDPTDIRLNVAGAKAPVMVGEVASIYRVVKGGQPVDLSRNGSPLADTPIPSADTFSTIVITRDGSPHLISDSTDGRNDLKVQLRVYNLVTDCAGAVTVVDGPTVFADVGTNKTLSRAINPVEARLEGRCGDKISAPFQLPSLKAGDHFSLFLIEGASGPELRGQRDETEPYRGTQN